MNTAEEMEIADHGRHRPGASATTEFVLHASTGYPLALAVVEAADAFVENATFGDIFNSPGWIKLSAALDDWKDAQ